MKKIYILFSIIAFTITSCKEDFIELAPKDQISGATFFQTEAQYRLALAAAYVPLRSLIYVDYVLNEMRSDNTYYENYSVNRGAGYVYRENIADFSNDAANTITAEEYYVCYNGIARCNSILGKIDNSSITDVAKADIGGQARFLRAFYYFQLVKCFGGVPLFIKQVTTVDETFIPRSSVGEVYNQIIADALEAINKLAPPAKFPQTGLATKGSATMLLADVYLTLKRYSDAEVLLKTLTTMGYGLNANFADAFATTNKNSKESVFEVQYNEGLTDGQQSNFIYMFLPRSTNTTIITGIKTDNTSTGGYNIPTQDLIKSFEPNDKRFDASIGMAEGTYNSSMFFTFTANKSVINYMPASGTVGIPYIKKYLHAHSNPNNTNDNWPVYRYSEVLLSLAEVLNEQGKGSEALTYLNLVRDRAFGVGVSPVITTNQAALRSIILHERRVELTFEDKRWPDLVRTNNAISVMSAFGTALKQTVSYVPSSAFLIDQNKFIYPIPYPEISINPEIIQNPGYY